MANINVNDLLSLNLSGAELLNDSESFLTELSDETEQMGVIGGCVITLSGCANSCCDYTCVRNSAVQVLVDEFN